MSAPTFLNHLTDLDTAWLSAAGRKHQLVAGQMLFTIGQMLESIWVVLLGELKCADNPTITAPVRAGVVLGELAVLAPLHANASLVASTDCLLLELDLPAIHERIAADSEFARRFYAGIREQLAWHLTQGRGQHAADGDHDSVLDDASLDDVNLAGDRFDQLVRMVMRADLS